MYQDKHKYNVIKGIIPDFGYDVKFAVVVDGEKKNEIPESQAKGSNGKFYKVEVNCDNNVDGEWDYNAWNVKLNGVVENSKCTLSFASNMSNEERDNLLKEGVTYRRNTYRGQDITKYKTGTKINGRDLYQQISDCTFDDIYVGDYILSNQVDADGNKIKWLIADINNYLYSGTPNITECHATIIPAKPLKIDQMNTYYTTGVVYPGLKLTTIDGQERTSIGAYVGSKMKQEILPNILKDYVKPDFNNHIITYSNYLTDGFDENAVNNTGNSTGSANSAGWYYSEIDLMSEVNVLGSIVASSSFNDVGIDNRQYAIFQLRPEFINGYDNTNFTYWLKTVVESASFAVISYAGHILTPGAPGTFGIRPRFLIN